ncbi:NAD-dependent succinate-semialdehyde dehydrogenase [Rhodococcus sovatensis]|uniref:NAD-dependent succinate-semialdehyde dehydrogenase n=1 Tax=Rhodococcus sovatensis TaxID=1805840 RepID=A0ABZ2PM35_9NOCA
MPDYAVVNPRTGENLADYPIATSDEVDKAVARASAAYGRWGRVSSVAERTEMLRHVARLHRERREFLADTMHREMGKPIAEALDEVDYCAAIYDFYADNAERFLADEQIELPEGEGSALIRRTSVGPLLGIMPWNFPCYQIARFAAPNLAAGNTVLIKPAPQCPESAVALEQLARDAGFPDGAYVNVFASNEQVETIIADARVQGVSLTGSERAGAAVAEIAGRNLKKVVLELGGSDPFILLSTDDLAASVQAAVGARAYNTGQVCNAGKRFIVIEALYNDFVAAFTAELASVSMSNPLSSKGAADNLADQVRRAVDGGAVVQSAGEPNGAFYPASVLTSVESGNEIYREELFGPVAMVFTVTSEQEAIALANDTPFGLGSYVFTTDPEQAQRVADQLDVGMVFINGVGSDGVEMPFGGVKRSGFGRELGKYGIEEFLNKKLIRTVR